MDKEIRQDKIDRYLNNEMERTELENFKRQINEDKKLAKEIELVRDMEEAVEDIYLDTEVLPKLRAMSEGYFKEEVTSSKPKFKKSWIISFILLVVISLSAFLFWKYSNSIPEEETIPKTEIFATYFQPYTANNLQRGNTADISYQTAIDAYQAKKYAAAIPILEEAMKSNIDDNDVTMLLANSYLSVNPPQTTKAIDLFQTLSEGTNLYKEDAQWYLALSYLQNEAFEKAKPLLENLVAKEIGKYPKLAQEVLEKL